MTRLKALELFGFKSFADRTRFEFPEGITVVVGPNGSGKSNVVDAIKWVLGEQSVRSLRGRDMTDVIFAGSASRKPLNAAETSLVFDNTARQLPVDVDDVQITRRVYRSGESEYLVNGAVSRLRDIRELFSGTGAATEAYSVIEQGRVDALLVASGKDRRAVFEEAAGITRFRARRAEALRRLERTEQNRQRLADIVGEVASRLDTVKHQAARARRYRQMSDRLRLLRLSAATGELAEADESVAHVETALMGLRQRLADTERDAAAGMERATGIDDRQRVLEPRLASLHQRLAHDRQSAAAADATLTLLRQRRHELDGDVARIADEVRVCVDREHAVGATLAAALDQVADVERQLDQVTGDLSGREQAAAGSHESAAALRARLAEEQEAAAGLERGVQRLAADMERAGTLAEEGRRAATAAHAAVGAAQRQHATLVEAAAGRDGALEAARARIATTNHLIEHHESLLAEGTALLESTWRDVASWRAKLEACRERRRVLEEITERHEGLSNAARALLGRGNAVPGLRGVTGDLIDAPLEWAALVDAVLGSAAQRIVVHSLDDVLRWFGLWEETSAAQEALATGGRITFLETDVDEPRADPDLGGHPGVIGRLDELVSAALPEADRDPLVRRLLGRAWVVERLDHAQALIREAPAGTIAVTRRGHCLSADGAFEVGSPGTAQGLVARRSELRSLCERDAELSRTVEETESRIRSIQRDIAESHQEVQRLRNRRQQEAETLASTRTEAERLDRDRAAAEAAIATAEETAREAERHAAALARACEELRANIAEKSAELAATRADVARTVAALDALDRDRGDVLSEITRLQILKAACTERLAAGRDIVAARRLEHAAATDDLAASRARHQAANRRRDGFDLELLAAGSAFAEATVAAERSAAALEDLTAERDGLARERQAAATDLDQARATASSLGDAIHGHELEVGEARHRRTRTLERVRDEYDIDLEAEVRAGRAPPSPAEGESIPADRTELEAEIETLRRKLAGMTTVNLEALAEADALTERLATLEAQLADVTEAKRSIEQLITRIDEESRRLLGQTIETVRVYFRELFERVFGGGQADIVLDPDVDLLETSVEIVARPPGKEPRSISLLSGGEKTMTCVALLLALFRSRPSPFCVLDEVDAALDEANVDRFVSVLRDFLSSTQFIVVTHSKKTMATADTLYGVTMEESGVSKRVSVRFESAATQAGLTRAKAA